MSDFQHFSSIIQSVDRFAKPDHPMHALRQSLQDYPLAMLRAIAELNGITLRSNRNQLAVQQLTTVLIDVNHWQSLLPGCSQEARAALDTLLRSDGRSLAQPFQRRFGTIRAFGPGRLEREKPYRKPANATEELWYRGLLHRAFAHTPSGSAEFLYIPEDLAQVLPQPEPLSASLHLTAMAPPQHVQLNDDALLQDVCTILCLAQADRIRLSAARSRLSWRAHSLYELNRHLLQPAPGPQGLLESDPGTAGALALALVLDLDWLRVDGYRLRLNARTVRSWLADTRAHQRRQLMDAWRQSTSWNDLCRTPSLRCEDTGSWANDPIDTRNRLLSLLVALDPATWYQISELTAAIYRLDPDFQRPDGDYDTWYIRSRAEQRFLRGFEHWGEVEKALIQFIIQGPLHWLGVVELGGLTADRASTASERLVFRLCSAGSAWMAGEPPPAEPVNSGLTVLPNYTIRVPWDAPLLDRFQVSRFTTWEPPQEDTTGRQDRSSFHYRITQKGLRRAAQQGISSQRIMEFLRERVSDELPANVTSGLERWRT